MTDQKDPQPAFRRRVREGLYNVRSFLVHGRHQTGQWDYSHHVIPPLSSSVTYRLDSAERGAMGFEGFAAHEHREPGQQPVYIYDRLDEPTRAMLEDHLAMAEGGEIAICFSTGMAAIAAAFGVLTRAGQHFVAHQTLYGCTYSLLTSWLPRFGIEGSYVDLTDLEALDRSIRPGTRIVYFETPTNPTLEIIDIQAVCAVVKKHNARREEADKIHVVVDNTFASPAQQRPLEYGADLVVASLTKNIGGFGTDMGGVVIGSLKYETDLILYRKDFGGALAPKTAWPILVYGLPTLDLRLGRQAKTARKVAAFLADHPLVDKVHYPGREDFPWREVAERQMRNFDGEFAPGIMIYFELAGDPDQRFERGRALVDDIAANAYTLTLAVSLGQLRTLIEMPSAMTHSVLPSEVQCGGGIDPGGIRLSIGIEDAQDIIRDLGEALGKLS
ncbi:MAG: aminotransferase class I/II-fold pyridoxal phosphate-dependent enzyme [Acidobacteriota bacterium]|nr:aminotransferase class I/II-fold pyridoxal phosphate-dependent enzyme [Acidobacteriota bacterium]